MRNRTAASSKQKKKVVRLLTYEFRENEVKLGLVYISILLQKKDEWERLCSSKAPFRLPIDVILCRSRRRIAAYLMIVWILCCPKWRVVPSLVTAVLINGRTYLINPNIVDLHCRWEIQVRRNLDMTSQQVTSFRRLQYAVQAQGNVDHAPPRTRDLYQGS